MIDAGDDLRNRNAEGDEKTTAMASHPSVSRTLQLIPTTKPRVRTPRTSSKKRLKDSVPVVQEATSPFAGCERKPTCEESDTTTQRAVHVDSDVLSELFVRQKGKLCQSAFSVLRNKQDAEDALQEGLLSAYLHLASFEGKSQLSTWVTRTVINAALMNRRKLLKDPKRSAAAGIAPSDDWPPDAVDRHPGPEQAYVLLELKNLMATQMRQLTPALQWAFHLRHVENLSVRKAASLAGVIVTAMKARAFRAHQQLRSLLGASGASSKGQPRLSGRSCQIGGSDQISLKKEQRRWMT